MPARVHSIPLPGRGEIGSVIGLWRCQPERLGRQRGAGRVHSIPLPPGWPTPEGADRGGLGYELFSPLDHLAKFLSVFGEEVEVVERNFFEILV